MSTVCIAGQHAFYAQWLAPGPSCNAPMMLRGRTMCGLQTWQGRAPPRRCMHDKTSPPIVAHTRHHRRYHRRHHRRWHATRSRATRSSTWRQHAFHLQPELQRTRRTKAARSANAPPPMRAVARRCGLWRLLRWRRRAWPCGPGVPLSLPWRTRRRRLWPCSLRLHRSHRRRPNRRRHLRRRGCRCRRHDLPRRRL